MEKLLDKATFGNKSMLANVLVVVVVVKKLLFFLKHCFWCLCLQTKCRLDDHLTIETP
jgi:hypothetical protein